MYECVCCQVGRAQSAAVHAPSLLASVTWVHVLTFLVVSLFLSNIIAMVIGRLRSKRIDEKSAVLEAMPAVGDLGPVPVVLVTGASSIELQSARRACACACTLVSVCVVALFRTPWC
jgi:hypothetical protein